MKLGLVFGYWGRGPHPNMVELAQEAERLGFDSIWFGESWGSDVFSPLTWIGAHTSTIKLGTGVVQISARTPTATAMHAITIDHLTNGRLILGLGVSGPQVVEGWYGQPYGKPLARTREYVEIIRAVLRREGPLEHDGAHYHHPYTGEGAVGLGKPLKVMTHPLRADLPIYLGSEGPKNVAMTAASLCTLSIADDIEAALSPVKATLGFYIGGMGARTANFHADLMARMGYESEARKIQDLFFDGRRDDAIATVPTEFADEISLVGSPERIRDRLQAWEDSPVTTLLVNAGDADTLRRIADLVLG
jgi:alkanesulfonate monooxygenase SsuD/methylene tetrahydromethanopterin reductase-like flavin-dependent oxidoreductase (luciferase family)